VIATLIGSTGLTGSVLVRQLLDDPAIANVISVSRRPLNISNSKLKEVLVKENFEKVDHTAIVDFAKIANAHGQNHSR